MPRQLGVTVRRRCIRTNCVRRWLDSSRFDARWRGPRPTSPLRRDIDNGEVPVVKTDDAGLVGDDRRALVGYLDTLIERDLLGLRGSQRLKREIRAGRLAMQPLIRLC